MKDIGLCRHVTPDWNGFARNIRREGTPPRVFYFEHGIDTAMQSALAERFGLCRTLKADAPQATALRAAEVHAFLGLEMVRVFPPGGRICEPAPNGWTNEAGGAITSWAEFEAYRWPEAKDADLSVIECYEKHLPANMRAFHVVSLWEAVRDLMGFETVCFKFYEEPDLVQAMLEKVTSFSEAVLGACCDAESFGAIYVADDLGHKTSLMISPELIRRYILPCHRRLADLAHRKGKLFFLHSCGQVYSLTDDFVNFVGIDAKHSFEDAVLPVTEAKRRYGDRLSLLGGMDVDLLARSDEATIRAKTREILEVCMPGGGYCLGSGNWVTRYIPLEHYLAMLDEARRFGA